MTDPITIEYPFIDIRNGLTFGRMVLTKSGDRVFMQSGNIFTAPAPIELRKAKEIGDGLISLAGLNTKGE